MGTGQVPKATGGFLNILKGLVGGLAGIGSPSSGAGSTPDVSSTVSYPEMASGGYTQANTSYLVGENGPELFRSTAGGHISNAGQTRQILSGGGSAPVFNIDARGTDPHLTRENVMAGFRQVHSESVSQSIRAVHQSSARTPQRG